MIEFPPSVVIAAVLTLFASFGALQLSRVAVARSLAALAAIISAVIAAAGAATCAEVCISLGAVTSIGIVGAGMVLLAEAPPGRSATRRTH